jgi:CRP-like cAMP-binding protein
MTRADLLSQVSLFADLTDEELLELAARCRRRSFERGELLFQEGDPATALYLLETGCVKLVLVEHNGEETILHVAGPGESLGELSLVDGGPRSATGVAMERVETLALYRADFLDFIDRHRSVERAVMKQLAALVRRSNERLQDVTALKVGERLTKLLHELADRHGEATPGGIRIRLPLTQQDLGRMLGLSRTSLYRQLQRLVAAGLVSVDRDGFVIHQPEALRKRSS